MGSPACFVKPSDYLKNSEDKIRFQQYLKNIIFFLS